MNARSYLVAYALLWIIGLGWNGVAHPQELPPLTSPEATAPTTAEALESALLKLLARRNEDAFVILEDRDTEKFVQFGRGPTLRLDVPMVALDPQEASRALEAFKRLGVSGPSHVDAPDPSAGELMRRHSTLEKDFGTDARAATKAALELFVAIYQLETVHYVIYEN